MYLFVNHLVLAKSEETSMYFTICKETGIHSLTRLLYVKSNNCVELYESMERIKAHFCNERTLLDHKKPTLWEERVIVNPLEPNEAESSIMSCQFISTMLDEFAPKFFKSSSFLTHY